MKIVYLADAPYPHTWRWVKHFAGEGIDCHVISFRPAEIQGATVHHIDGGEPLGKARYLINARRVRQLIHDVAPDLVHALHLTSYGFFGALSGYKPLIISVWGTDILEAPHLTPFHNWLTRYALSKADAITATGLYLATETTRYAPRSKPVTVIPYGVDLDRFSRDRVPGASRDRGRSSGPDIVIGATSRFSPEKGVRYLIEAFATLHQRFGSSVRLRLAGEGPEHSNLEALRSRLRLGGSIDFVGWLDYEELPAFLHGLDIFVLPSTYEGFGVSAVEASAAGLPIVASNVHGIPDVVRDGVTGILVAPKDVAGLAGALTRLIGDPRLRESMGRSGREYVAGRYDWRANTQQMASLYERLRDVIRKEEPVWK